MKRDILCLFVFTFLLLINLSSFSEETIRELKSVPGECLNVVNTVRQENNLPELISDPILNESAKDYLYYFIKKHGTDFRNSGDSIDNEMQKSILAENLFTDVISAVYSELFITTNPKKIYALLKENQKTVKKEYNRFGIAVLEYKEFYYFYFSFSEKKTEIQINSNKFDLFDRFHFDVQILDTINYRDPSVYITLPDGTVSEMKDITVIGNSFTVDFDRFKENGIYTFEIIMETDRGPEPTNIFKIQVGDNITDTAADNQSAKPGSHVFPEDEMLYLINKDRKTLNLPELNMLPEINAVAEKHSKEMADEGDINHTSPITGDVTDRIKEWKDHDNYFILKLGENLSKAKDIPAGQKGLMESPGHRGNILDPDFNTVGIGVAKGKDGYLYITQIFLYIEEFPDSGNLMDKIFSEVNQKRISESSPALVQDQVLNDIANLLLQIAVNLGYDAFSKDFEGNVNEVMIKKGYEGELNFLTFMFTDISEIISSAEFFQPETTKIGIAIYKDIKQRNYTAIIVLE